MILADKIIELRKKAGFSQEELAEKMGVSRQSVSKWEGALSIPDLDKILLMSEIFGVSTDYLLKDELGDEIPSPKEEISESTFRKVSLEEANEFIKTKDETAPMVALGVVLCILSPVTMFFLIAMQISGKIGITENGAGGIGIIALVLMVVPAVALFITSGMKTGRFEYLEKEPIELAYGVAGMVKQKDKQFTPFGVATNIIATCLCVVSPAPILVAAFFSNAFGVCISIAATLAIIGIAVMLYIIGTVRSRSMHRLLKDGEFTEEGKKKDGLQSNLAAIYWLSATAIYLVWSFLGGGWGTTWVLWPVAGVIYPIVCIIAGKLSAFSGKK